MEQQFYDILKKYWDYDSFRPLQMEIIKSVHQSIDTLALLPTGGGKSLCFQVPALAKEGLCLVITPLIALMLDQVERLKSLHIPAQAIYSGMSEREIELVYNRAAANQLKFLYISPERLKTQLFLHQLEGFNVNLIAVDEAHCISEWGKDFRPAYNEIREIRPYFPHVPILALTASATDKVIEDIKDKLDLKKGQVFKKSFFRDNLKYIVRKVENKLDYLLQIVNKLNGTGIIYVRNRKLSYELAQFLYKNNIAADYYHAGLEQAERNKKQSSWQNNYTKVMVCTNAFGMGIDKPDVRFVIHYDLPDSLEAYYQEAGRGGRDGKIAFAGVLYQESDIEKLKNQIELSFPPLNSIKKIYAALGNFFQIPIGAGKDICFPFDFPRFLNQYQLNFTETYSSLKILEKEGWIQFEAKKEVSSRIHIIISNKNLYQFYILNPDFEGFIRLLLSYYQGLFTEFVNINEYKIARKANIPLELVIKYLNILEEHNILIYKKRSNTGFITYVHERMDHNYLHISAENYRLRKQEKERKIQSVLHFLNPNISCRSRFILEYFDENNPKDCGMCDLCVEKQNQADRLQKMQERTIQLLKEKRYSLKAICLALKTNQERFLKSVQKLLDENIIAIDSNKELYLTEDI